MEWLLILSAICSLVFVVVLGGQGDAERKLPDYLEILGKAEYLDDSAVGYAAKRSETYQAFEKALAAGESIYLDLDWLRQHASPAGRIYAAILINQLNKEDGRKAYQELQKDTAMVDYRSGSLVESRIVGEIAEDLLRGETIIIFNLPKQ
ncbi:MAG: hypothetical protein AB1489_07695 [Acidobacteriota bacterium]